MPDQTSAWELILSGERYAQLGASEQFVLIVSDTGFGKRMSSHRVRVFGRGGQGIGIMAVGGKNNAVVAAFPVEDGDDVMLISDAGQTIRSRVSDVSIQGRSSEGVTVFRVDEGERVVSVERIEDVSGDGSET